jgi:hypothetical protein
MILVMLQINEVLFNLCSNLMSMTSTLVIPEAYVRNSFSYDQFRKLIIKLIGEGKVTGHEQKESYLEYSKLNDHRMSRWDKHFQPSEEMINTLNAVKEPRTWLLITEGWCGDSAQTASAMAKIASLNPLINFRVVLRDENPRHALNSNSCLHG